VEAKYLKPMHLRRGEKKMNRRYRKRIIAKLPSHIKFPPQKKHLFSHPYYHSLSTFTLSSSMHISIPYIPSTTNYDFVKSQPNIGNQVGFP
jgi:hypothetical protein